MGYTGYETPLHFQLHTGIILKRTIAFKKISIDE